MRTMIQIFAFLVVASMALEAAAFCGDGRIDGNEECDVSTYSGPLLGGATCFTRGFVSGTLRCNRANCRFDTGDCSNSVGSLCGNGVRESGEECDGGCGCDDVCENRTVICGDGCVAGVEECDDGAQNSDLAPDACRSSCELPHCGDGTVDTGEQCDDYYNSDFVPDTCRLDCSNPSCGDGVIDVQHGEQCDLGPNNSDLVGSPCSTLCFIPFCGNGLLEAGESCDDGNVSSLDDCTQLCRPNVCGDGLVHAAVEECDDATCGYACEGTPGSCGNGVVDAGEECDDGATNSDLPDVSCRTDCSLRRCGDGIVDTGEACDRSQDCLADCTQVP